MIGLLAAQPKYRSSIQGKEKRYFVFFIAFRQALGPINSFVYRVPGALSGGTAGGAPAFTVI
jgi:hypothetical protein